MVIILGIDVLCLVCNEFFRNLVIFINFLYNDDKYQGLPVCESCIPYLYEVWDHLNCRVDVIIDKEPLRGLDIWIYKTRKI